jgi:N-acetyl-gamma-glutamyl-phosphate reductase
MERVAVIGATGYAGSELVAILARHPEVELASLYSSTGGASVPFSSLHPALSGMNGPSAEPFAFEKMAGEQPETVFLATPNETSAELAPRILETGAKVIDLSGAFRLREPVDYPRWYGFDHPRPDLLPRAVYGLTEWCNGELSGASMVANPGCYPTAILLALRPLRWILDREQPLICDVKSGVSGAGKKSEVAYSFAELAGNFKTYSVGHHRHEPEVRQGLNLGDRAPLVFVAHLLPTVRGILATLHVTFTRNMTAAGLTELYQQTYENSPFVRVRPEGDLPELKHVVNTPRAEIGFVLLNGGRRAVIVSVIDNLLKGAASQAVQNFNRVHGFDEKEALQ